MRLLIGRLPIACDILMQVFECLPDIKYKILVNSYKELMYKKSINTKNLYIVDTHTEWMSSIKLAGYFDDITYRDLIGM